MQHANPCLAVVLAACSSPNPSRDAQHKITPSEAEAERALQTLERATAFEGDAIGYAGIPSEGAEAFAVLWNHPHAADHFATLSVTATTAGRLYGLLGLAHCDSTRYAEALRQLRAVSSECEFMRGCVRASLPTSRLAGDIDNGSWDEIVAFAQGPR